MDIGPIAQKSKVPRVCLIYNSKNERMMWWLLNITINSDFFYWVREIPASIRATEGMSITNANQGSSYIKKLRDGYRESQTGVVADISCSFTGHSSSYAYEYYIQGYCLLTYPAFFTSHFSRQWCCMKKKNKMFA